MTVDSFFSKWNNKGIDFDHYYGFQCMDLAEEYNRDVIGAPRIGGNAIDVWTHYPSNFYDKVVNTPTNMPKKGDIVIWGQGVGRYGHIAVCKIANVMSFTSFDQNWPLHVDSNGNGLGVAHFQLHNYNSVLGWLTPKKKSGILDTSEQAPAASPQTAPTANTEATAPPQPTTAPETPTSVPTSVLPTSASPVVSNDPQGVGSPTVGSTVGDASSSVGSTIPSQTKTNFLDVLINFLKKLLAW